MLTAPKTRGEEQTLLRDELQRSSLHPWRIDHCKTKGTSDAT